MQSDQVHADMPVDDIMEAWPATVPVFIELGLLCVGCAFGTFHTLSEACEAHDLEMGRVEARIATAITAR